MERCFMTREETLKILMTMQVAYPNYKVHNKDFAIDIWHDLLSDYTYQVVSAALKAYILTDTSGFAPSVGELVEKIQLITKPDELNEMEAWSLVRKAIKNGWYGYEKEYSKLPEIVQKCVGNSAALREWSCLDASSIDTVIQSNFIKTYRNAVKRNKDISKLPPEYQAVIDKLNPQAELISSKKEVSD